MPKCTVKCPECGHEFPSETKWSAKDWVLYGIAVGPIGLMALAIALVAAVALLKFLGVLPLAD